MKSYRVDPYGTTCSSCHRRAVVSVVGKWANGREMNDLRCENHAPLAEHVGTWAYFGPSERSFRITRIDPVAA